MFVRVVELTQNGERLVAGVIWLESLKDGTHCVGYASKLSCLDVAKGLGILRDRKLVCTAGCVRWIRKNSLSHDVI